MSTQITTAFVNQFSANVQMLSQQMGSLLRNAVDTESVNGEKAFFDQVGQAAAVLRTKLDEHDGEQRGRERYLSQGRKSTE